MQRLAQLRQGAVAVVEVAALQAYARVHQFAVYLVEAVVGSEHLHGRALLLPAGCQARQAFRRACVVAGARSRLRLDAQNIHFLHHAADTRLRKGAQADGGEDDDDEGDERGAHYQSTFPGSRAARRSRSPRVVCKKRLPRVSRQPR